MTGAASAPPALRGEDPHELLPGVHRVASLAKRWLLGTHQGSVDDAHLQAYLDEFVFRFNRRSSRSRGLVFHRVLELAVGHEPGPLPRPRRQPADQGKRPPAGRARLGPPAHPRPPAGQPAVASGLTGLTPLKWIPRTALTSGASRSRPTARGGGSYGMPCLRCARDRERVPRVPLRPRVS